MMQNTTQRVTEYELRDIAIDSIRKNGDLSDFYKYVKARQDERCPGAYPAQVGRFLRRNDTVIWKTGMQLREKDANKLDRYPDCSPNFEDVPRTRAERGPSRGAYEALIAAGLLRRDNTPEIVYPECSPAAITRSEKLVTDISTRYGWQRQDKIFFHPDLGLLFYAPEFRLSVMIPGRKPMP